MPLPANVTVARGDGPQAARLLDPLCELYDAVFSQPPFGWVEGRSADHRRSLERLLADPSFGLATAHADTGLVGFGYGVALRSDTDWWQGAVEPLQADLTSEWPGRTFAVIDLGVRQDRRGQGIGRGLLDTLLAGRGEERATLAVRPAATQTQEFYRHLGWQRAGRVEGAPGQTAPFFDLYVLPLAPKP